MAATDLSGKVALVTGGSRGLGAAIAEALVRAGAKVYISARTASVCDETAAAFSEHGECVSLPFDLADMAGVEGLAAALAEREDRIDILVNNAGVGFLASLDEFPERDWDPVMDVNVKSVFFMTQKALPLLRKAARADAPARVINIGSIGGIDTWRGGANWSYVASKAAVHHLTRMLSGRLAPENILVNAIAPGPFDTDMMAFALDDPAQRARIEQSIPVGRVGQPKDIAGVVLFLCAPESAYMTGAILPLDGGITASR